MEGGAGILRHGWRAHCTLRARIKGEARARSPAPPLPAQLVSAAHRRRRRPAARSACSRGSTPPARSGAAASTTDGEGEGAATCLAAMQGAALPMRRAARALWPGRCPFFPSRGPCAGAANTQRRFALFGFARALRAVAACQFSYFSTRPSPICSNMWLTSLPRDAPLALICGIIVSRSPASAHMSYDEPSV